LTQSSLEPPGGQESADHQGHGQGQLGAGVAGQGNLGVVGLQEVAAASVADETVSGLHALLVGGGRGEASSLEGSIGGAVAVADVALVAELVDRADLGRRIGLRGAAGARRVAGALEALQPGHREGVPVAALGVGAQLALQIVCACVPGGVVQVGGTATNCVAICR